MSKPQKPDAKLSAENAELRERVAELEARPAVPPTLPEIAALVEAACTERDDLARRLAQEIRTTTALRGELATLRTTLATPDVLATLERVERFG